MNQSTEDVYKQKKLKNRIIYDLKGGRLKIKKTLKIISIIAFIIVLNINLIINSVKAVDINSANIISGGDCGSLLIYKGIYVKTYYSYYLKDGKEYPAYCLDKTKQGVKDDLTYSVSIHDSISDVKLWRIIINGYPYKTIQELGCNNKEEAFSATKQAIYCYIHGNNPNDYSGIGEAGNRTVRAIKQILDNAERCTETKISNNVKIIKEQEQFDVDNKEKTYVSKTYSIKAGTTISNYKVQLTKIQAELPEGIKITDINNNEKTEFAQNEKFKILIPIRNLTKENKFNIEIQTKINSKPILYGKAPNASYQDYALTAATYEDASGKTEDKFYKNETKVKIIKQDAETKERLENVEFNILDSDKKVIYSNLKTNSNGEIEVANLIPGKYYIQEVSTKDGYELNNEVFEFNVNLNEEFTITIDNSFKEEPEPKTTKQEISRTVENVKKLPVTGM